MKGDGVNLGSVRESDEFLLFHAFVIAACNSTKLSN